MLNLRKTMCRCFRFLAMVSLLVSFFSLFHLFRPFHPHELSHGTRSPAQSDLLLSMFLHVLIIILRVTPVVLAFLYGMAWWTVKTAKPSGRGWAIAASLAILLLVFPFSTVTYYAFFYAPAGSWIGFLIPIGVVLALGISGLVAFVPHDSIGRAPIEPAKPPRIAGDGTSRLLDALAGVIGIAGYFAAIFLWHRWGRAQQLPRVYVGLLQLIVILLVVTVVHELGHAVVGSAFGMKVRAFIAGPFQWRIRDGRWKFQFLPAKFLSAGGATALVPTDPHQSQSSQICMIAAGPMVNLLTGLIALYAALIAKGQPYVQFWGVLAYFSTISLIVFASNLIPMQSEASYSDGGRIYQLLQGGPLADLYRVFNLVGSTVVTPLRPRDYDINAIQRAEISFTQGMQALLLRLFASSYFMDHRIIRQAADAVAEAERIQQESALDLPAELCMAFVYRVAFLRRDAVGARLWWTRMEAKKPTHFGVDYWLAQSALSWVEGRKEEAREAWNKGNLLAQRLPAAGDSEFDRYRSALLHDCIENAESSVAS
jgi:hypothetical protein